MYNVITFSIRTITGRNTIQISISQNWHMT